jgi:hypothetical protein
MKQMEKIMSESEQVDFKLTLSAEWYRLPCHVKIWLDDELIEDSEISERPDQGQARVIEFSRKLADGEHAVKIQYLGKTWADTTVDDQGNILRDHLLMIDEVELDQIELGYLLFKASRFYPDREIRPDLPEIMEKMMRIGYNGTWQLKFQVPTYSWFLENL